MTYSLVAMLCLAAGPAPAVATPGDATVVATVADEPILLGEARQTLAEALRGKKLSPEILPYARAQVLEDLVARRLVLAYARRLDQWPSPEDLAAAKARALAQAAAQGRTLPAVLGAASADEAGVGRQLAWSVIWGRYLAKYLTAERDEAYFQAHRRELDGTELAVSHVLLRPAPDKTQPAAIEQLVRRAEEIRGEIVAGKLSMAEAARKYSAGPSSRDGGRLGWIGRRGPMDEAFTRAAFALKKGELSPPVRSPFGIHLIRCDEVRPGSKGLADVRREVEDSLTRELLEKLAGIERKHAAVRYTAAWPHFKPGTRELTEP
ncbi:MAG: peptidylprolyl isomerase [Thermoguttaceae bacterium]|jgi:parvulin-like peptidyl-prolyl isomerase